MRNLFKPLHGKAQGGYAGPVDVGAPSPPPVGGTSVQPGRHTTSNLTHGNEQYRGMSYEAASREAARLIAQANVTGYWLELPEQLGKLRARMHGFHRPGVDIKLENTVA